MENDSVNGFFGGHRKLWSGLAGLVVLAALVFGVVLAVALHQGQVLADVPVRIADAALIERGAYVARLGDCTACHTAPGGQPMAGGQKIQTPFGAVYSTNITPDAATGIGRYTFAEFDRAMRRGVAADGHNLYPAMPYPSYARISGDDMQALFAYLQHGIAPVSQANKPLGVKWPFNQRWGVALWNLVFLDNAPFQPDPARGAQWNRGAYLAQSLGHCGACHTPRGIGFQEKAMSDAGPDGALYLSGETVDAWSAINLRNLWTAGDLVTLLKTGRNRYAAAGGGMADVIEHSTQHMMDADLEAIAVYLKSLPGGIPRPPAESMLAQIAKAELGPEELFSTKGGLGYVQFCASCHQTNGQGFAPAFPPLARNPAVLSDNPDSLIHVALTGWKTVPTQTHPRVYTMPAFDRLSDRELADILNFVRVSWGGKAGISASRVGKLRRQLVQGPADAPDDAFKTPRLAAMLSAPNAEQIVRGLRLNLLTKALLPDNVGDSLNCASCHLNGGTVAQASPYVGLASQFPSYAARASKVITLADRINGCFVRSMNGKPLSVDSEDMRAMLAYFAWMNGGHRMKDAIPGRGTGKIDDTLTPNLAHGQMVYAAQCAVCHGEQGQGTKSASGGDIYPPLWGDQSFNIGAGMARLYTAAAFVKNNMPIGAHDRFPLGQGGLSDQDALDVAAYFTTQPRADFPPKSQDWPNGGKPKDARY